MNFPNMKGKTTCSGPASGSNSGVARYKSLFFKNTLYFFLYVAPTTQKTEVGKAAPQREEINTTPKEDGQQHRPKGGEGAKQYHPKEGWRVKQQHPREEEEDITTDKEEDKVYLFLLSFFLCTFSLSLKLYCFFQFLLLHIFTFFFTYFLFSLLFCFSDCLHFLTFFLLFLFSFFVCRVFDSVSFNLDIQMDWAMMCMVTFKVLCTSG